MPFLSLVCLTPWQSLLVAEQELKAIINTDPVKRMNNSFFIIVFFVSKGELKLVIKGGLEKWHSEEETKIVCRNYIS